MRQVCGECLEVKLDCDWIEGLGVYLCQDCHARVTLWKLMNRRPIGVKEGTMIDRECPPGHKPIHTFKALKWGKGGNSNVQKETKPAP